MVMGIKLRQELKTKHEKKLEFLNRKAAHDESEELVKLKAQIPSSLSEFSNLKILNNPAKSFVKDGDEYTKHLDTDGVEVVVGEGVQLDEDEVEFLKLPPKFCVQSVLTAKEMEIEIEVTNAKLRWDLKNDDGDV